MEQSPSRELNTYSIGCQIPRLVCNPEVNYSVHKIMLPTLILSQMNSVHTLKLCFSEV
jgi:hypothetical protein